MSVILTRPITPVSFSVSQPRNIQEPAKSLSKRLNFWGGFSCRKLNFWGGFSCRKSVSWDIRRRGLSQMKGVEWALASTTQDGVPAFEQEAFVDESPTLEGGGIEATINNMSKWVVAAAFTALILWRHDAEALWAAFGSAVNALLSVTLKNILNQERPVSTLRPDPGMPSSHAQSIAYITAFFIISLIQRFGVNVLTTTLSGVLVVLGSYFTWLRVSQRLHTVSQVVVGAIVGSAFLFLWFWLWNTFVLNLFASFLLVRIVVTLGAIGFIIGFVLSSYDVWLNDV